MDDDTRKQIERAREAFRARGKTVHTELERSVAKACLVVERDIKLSMRNTVTDPDKAYPRGSRVHYASAEGEPPAIDYGRLVQAVTHRVETSEGGTRVEGFVGTNLPYGKMLEDGTSRMAPRPWLLPALRRQRNKIRELIAAAISGRTVSVEGDEE